MLLVDGDPPRIVAVGRVLEGGQTIHGAPILPYHVRVTIDEVRDPQAQVPVPTPEINFVGEAIGSFIAWPRALIMSHIATPHFTRPQKQPIHDTIIHEDDDMAKVEDDPLSKLMTRLSRLKKAPLELYWDLRIFGLPPHVPVYITLSDALEVIGGDRMLNISIIQLWCMYMDTIVVDQGRSSMYGFGEPQTIQPSGNALENRQHYLQTWMDESKRDVYLVPYIDGLHWQLMVIIPKACKIIWFCSLHRKMKNDLRTMLQGVIGKSQGQLVQILYSKVCNQQLDSWECAFYVMCWIKTIIRAVITDDWNERFKSTSPIPEDTIRNSFRRPMWTPRRLSNVTHKDVGAGEGLKRLLRGACTSYSGSSTSNFNDTVSRNWWKLTVIDTGTRWWLKVKKMEIERDAMTKGVKEMVAEKDEGLK
ncbi:hypothetical protein LR48_Vigan08g002700 [Vigna angularis]|uniref:DUF8039 domain-containing protein n=1 Tax=Phaseolus angularis TaxID=3914 RepID=A0A0L9V252_PHAAN|nr:hypothetical protein LR48_Vigan08g002700 [Vigna angularis]